MTLNHRVEFVDSEGTRPDRQMSAIVRPDDSLGQLPWSLSSVCEFQEFELFGPIHGFTVPTGWSKLVLMAFFPIHWRESVL